jgi:4-aminobutyrate aminotransferase-like enzyme
MRGYRSNDFRERNATIIVAAESRSGVTLAAMTDNLWLHFTRHGPDFTPPIITRGEGVTIFDDRGKSYLDGLSGLFTVQVGHGRTELAEAAARQASTLAFFPLWGYAPRLPRSSSPSVWLTTPRAT